MWKSLALVAIFSVLAQSAPAPQASEEIPPLISFKNGRVGVNFLGFKASAGLGGLLTGNAADGGLGASAETPFGQRAGAGLGGVVDGNGRSAGGLYAGATAGNGLAAGAGLGGVAGESGTYGGSFAGATNPYSGHQVVKASESGTIVEAPISVRKEVHVNAVPTTTYVKTRFSEEVVNPGSIKVVQKIKHRPHHHKVHYKYINSYYGPSVGTFGAGGIEAAVAPAPVHSTVIVTKTATPQLYNDIFNIPISTLGAVNKLLNGIASGTSGSVAVSKQITVGK